MSPDASPSSRNAKVAVVVLVACILAVAKWLGLFAQVGDPAHLAKAMLDLGGWGYVAFVLAYTVLQPFGVPGTVFVIAAPLIWPWPVAFALTMTGTMAASVVGFSFARFVGRDWVAPRIPERFRKYDDALGRRAFLTVFLLRLVFWMPQVLHFFFGVSKVRGWTHFWGSLAGYALPLFLMAFFGQRLFDVMKAVPAGQWADIAACTATLAVIAWWLGRACASGRRARSS